jgi:hypothetical protein
VRRLGVLCPVRHRAARDAWFYAYYRKDAQPCARVSPDGRYAVTDTHVYDLKAYRPVAELPFPTGPAGFVSSGSHIYAVDHANDRLVFLEVERLVNPRASEGRSRGAEATDR